MLLTNQKTINYEKFITTTKAFNDLDFVSAKVGFNLILKNTNLCLTKL